jgi:TetR/AcrR family transcriptional regulator, cholesterol catabolism regulator
MTAPSSRPPLKGNERRDRILQVAATMFSERGYHATSLQDIADEVDLLKGSLYYYFESKQDLLLEVARAAHVVNMDELAKMLDEVSPGIEKVRRYVEYCITTIADHPITVAAFYSEMRYLEAEHAQEIIEERDRQQQLLVDLIGAAQADGSVGTRTPPKLAAMGIVGLINSIARWYHQDGAWGADEIARAFADMVVDGLHRAG